MLHVLYRLKRKFRTRDTSVHTPIHKTNNVRRACTHTRTHIHGHACTHTRTHTHMCTHTHFISPSLSYTSTHTYLYTADTRTHTHRHTNADTHTSAHRMCTHTCTHHRQSQTHIRIHTYKYTVTLKRRPMCIFKQPLQEMPVISMKDYNVICGYRMPTTPVPCENI